MRIPRFTIRTMMLAVGVTALAVGFVRAIYVQMDSGPNYAAFEITIDPVSLALIVASALVLARFRWCPRARRSATESRGEGGILARGLRNP